MSNPFQNKIGSAVAPTECDKGIFKSYYKSFPVNSERVSDRPLNKTMYIKTGTRMCDWMLIQSLQLDSRHGRMIFKTIFKAIEYVL